MKQTFCKLYVGTTILVMSLYGFAEEVPSLPPLSEDSSLLSSAAEIIVKKIKFEGNSIFSDEELHQFIAHEYSPGDKINAEKLQQIKNKITQFYIDKGYINSGAIIPDQEVKEGIIHFKIIEGKLVKVDVDGQKKLRESYVKNRLEFGNKFLNINELQERLQLLQQNPLIQRLDAELGPGVQLGEAYLRINIAEKRPFQFQLTFNNHRSPSVGAQRGEIEFWHYNLTGLLSGEKAVGWGDTLYMRYGLTKGLKDYTFRYTFPINSQETALSVSVDRSDSEVVEEPFKQLDIESEADTYAIALTHPLYRTPAKELSMTLKLEKRSSKTFLLQNPFSFSPGVKDGESHLSVIRFSQDWLDRSRIQVLAARSTFSFGVGALDATINDKGVPDSRFLTWVGQFQWVRRLDFLSFLQNSQMIFRTDFQWANEDLLPLEKLSIGGSSTVRGYRENFLTRDRGLISSLEWRIPIWQWSIPKLSKNPEDGWLYLAPFLDYGRAWNAKSPTHEPKDIYSAGLGLRWSPEPSIYAEVYWGKALRHIEEVQDKDLQDEGVHFEVYWQF